MSRRCHLCGRRGDRGYVNAPARVLVQEEGSSRSRRRHEDTTITICTANTACRRRRGLRP